MLPRLSAISEAIRLLGGVCIAVTPAGEFVLYKPYIPGAGNMTTRPASCFELGLLEMLATHINDLAPADDYGFGQVVNALDRLRVDTNT
jgi:hypothetical protein